MRPKTMILFVIAVGCGLTASVGVSQFMEHASKNSGAEIATSKIFVAVTDINIGERLDAQNVKLEEWPTDRVPEGAIANLDELEERYPRTRLFSGEPILAPKLMDSNNSSKSVTIPKGYRVVATKVTVDSAVSGLVQPGDKVDLLVFLRKSAEIPETGTKTILHEVNVFSVDGETERSVDAEGQVRNVRTVSLLVKPEQAESIMLASELGRLFLSLRRPDDDIDSTSDGETVLTLLGRRGFDVGIGENRDVVKLAPPEPAAPVSQVIPVNTDVPTLEEEEEAPKWTMIVHTPTGAREFRWNDLKALPDEVGGNRVQNSTEEGPTGNPATNKDPETPFQIPADLPVDGDIELELE